WASGCGGSCAAAIPANSQAAHDSRAADSGASEGMVTRARVSRRRGSGSMPATRKLRLEEFLARPKVAERMAKDYVDLIIDTDRRTHGQQIYDKLKAGRSGGLPWLIMLDGDGKELV